MSITVLAAGMLTTFQDLGRHGAASLGVGSSGAMDVVAMRLANILVGNVENAATLEATLQGPRLRFDADALIAITGAEIDVRLTDRAVPMWRPVAVRRGSEISFGGMRRGARSYLAVGGGFDVPTIMRSHSVDVNGGMGRRVANHDVLEIGAGESGSRELWNSLRGGDVPFVAAKWSLDAMAWFDDKGVEPLGAMVGSHFEHMDESSQRTFFDAEFRIANDSNRVGYRLEGPPLVLRAPFELVSEAVVPGSVQLPPGGVPIALMAEAPTTGGYPRIAQIANVDLPRLAQRRPGDKIRFTRISLDDAQKRYLQREHTLASLARTVRERLRESK